MKKNFLWGAAYAGHQVDGGDVHSDTTFLENVNPTIFSEKSGEACRSWSEWKKDLDIAKTLGLNALRFSVEWSRIEPEPGVIDESALDRYDRFVDGCLERGLSPAATLSHFTAPHWFAKRGGWLNPDSSQLFADECERVLARIGDRLGLVVTLNEPNLYMLLSWMGLPDFIADIERATLDAAAKESGAERYRVGNVVLAEDRDALREGFIQAHKAAREVVKSIAPQVPVGLSLSVTDDIGIGARGNELVQKKRQECYEVWKSVVADDDFVGVQNYEQLIYGERGLERPVDGERTNQSGSLIRPESLANSTQYIYELTGRPIVVTEHGIGAEDDATRAEFIPQSLERLRVLKSAGVPVQGYFHWSLLDNFEWISGYKPKMGLCSVDRTTFMRTLKPSASVYAQYVHEYEQAWNK
jgi:beta-glucosidase